MQMSDFHDCYMQQALAEARKAMQIGEVPVGAVLVKDERVVARAYNEVESRCASTAHAEVLVLERASKDLGSWRLNDATLYVTLEPCTMCAGAILLSRVGRVVFGARDPRQGALGSVYDLSDHSELPHRFKVISGVCEAECASMLKDFFSKLR